MTRVSRSSKYVGCQWRYCFVEFRTNVNDAVFHVKFRDRIIDSKNVSWMMLRRNYGERVQLNWP